MSIIFTSVPSQIDLITVCFPCLHYNVIQHGCEAISWRNCKIARNSTLERAINACTNGKCLATKHHQTCVLILKWMAKRLKHVWSNADQTIDTSRWVSVVRMPASNMFDTGLFKWTKHRPLYTRTKEMFSIWSNVWCPSNVIKHDQTQSNTIKEHQTRRPNGKMFGHQTMFGGVLSPNISRLLRPLLVWSDNFTVFMEDNPTM